jgi:hypothetical protein
VSRHRCAEEWRSSLGASRGVGGTGKPLWSCADNSDGYIVASVVSHDGVVYAIAGRSNRSVAVKAGGTGEVQELWTSRNDSRVNSPVYHDGYLYGSSQESVGCL